MNYHPSALSLGIRDVIGAWIVCLAFVTVFFGYPLGLAAWNALDVQRHDAAVRLSIGAASEVCAGIPRRGRADLANIPRPV